MVARCSVGALLIIAAVLKGYALITYPDIPSGYVQSRPLQAAWIETEALLGVWLLSGIRASYARRVAIVLFVFLFFVTVVEAWNQAKSCGCFGPVPTRPWQGAMIDVIVVFALCVSHERAVTQEASARALALPAALITTSLVTVFAALLLLSRAATSDDGEQVIGNDSYAILQPDAWTGRTFPLARYVDVASELSSGAWTVLLYRHECPVCHNAIRKYEDLARSPDTLGGARIALIELPPYASNSITPMRSRILKGRLNEEKIWFVTTPVVVQLRNGLVTAVRDERESEH